MSNLRKEAENILKEIGDREALGVDWDDILDFIEERLRLFILATEIEMDKAHKRLLESL